VAAAIVVAAIIIGSQREPQAPAGMEKTVPESTVTVEPTDQDSINSTLQEQIVALDSARRADRLTDSVRLAEAIDAAYQQFKELVADKLVAASGTESTSPGQIRTRTYQLRDLSKQTTFDTAYQIASWVSGQTGVRPAFLLAVLTQESSLGQNVGTCNWRAVMKPDRDQQPFLQIMRELAMDPDATPVSCPMRDKSGKQIGWGGAMGPAQFLPSTWLEYRARIMAVTGKATANPWDIRDAFVAAALKLRADGADGTPIGEWSAAMRYFSGGTDPRYSLYGNTVQALANVYQADIDQLTPGSLLAGGSQTTQSVQHTPRGPHIAGTWIGSARDRNAEYAVYASITEDNMGGVSGYFWWRDNLGGGAKELFAGIKTANGLAVTGTKLDSVTHARIQYVNGHYTLAYQGNQLIGSWTGGEPGSLVLEKE
jgi:membrane-bound lytic murein transglycosylase B